ncbi:hypothetical protein C7R54_02585 [Achromobacter aloeverae]|uniref:Uncharacterized protein n=1 Tax=Achromobacter aloeverae TaxID=1750518 RepID=A0A4V1MSN5_9BURK|nr:hypothetical protein C7R54_02585 [Achromobacter aloeverae]
MDGGAGDILAVAAGPAGQPDEAALTRLALGGTAESQAACTVSMDASQERPRLTRRYAMRGSSVVSMSPAKHVERYGAEVRERLEKLRPTLHRWLDELRPDLEKLQVHQILIQGHVMGSRRLSGVVADMAKGYLVKLGQEAVKVRVAGRDDGHSTFGVTVCVYGTPATVPEPVVTTPDTEPRMIVNEADAAPETAAATPMSVPQAAATAPVAAPAR